MTNEPKRARSIRKPATSPDNAPPVYFLSLEVERVLCFKDRQVLDLSDSNGNPAQWTVILGDNGVGKTTLLRCLASMEVTQLDTPGVFLPLHCILTQNLLEWEGFEDLEKQLSSIDSQLACGFTLFSYKSQHHIVGLEKKPKILRIEVYRDHEGGGCSLSLTDIEENIHDLLPEPKQLKEVMCYGYGATRRVGEVSLSEDTILENSASLFSEEASLINAEAWLLQTDYAARSAAGKTRDRLQKQLNQIIEILKRILPDIEDIRIAPADEEIQRPRAEFLTPYGWVRLSSLGLGYRTAIAWMVDLAVRLFRRYPNSEDPLAEPAIVLVDEIDLHLHPKWQRNIMSFLTERFPNTQFIVTAHSPLVVQAAKDANIVLLRREGDRVDVFDPHSLVNPSIIDAIQEVYRKLKHMRSPTLFNSHNFGYDNWYFAQVMGNSQENPSCMI